MTALPEALARWKTSLTLFDPAVITALAPMMDRLSRALGPMAADDAGVSGDPAGYEGVATRGPYERLLPSEWLLADELPDEFLRRAAASEHLFYALARKRPRGRRAVTVVADVGPESFGTPRLAVLATLLVLAQRAQAAQAAFRWRLAQAEGDFTDDVGAVAIQGLLLTRADFVCGEEVARRALDSAVDAGEVWFVTGGEGARSAARIGASFVAVEDVLEPGARELAVRVRGPARDIAIRLPLPDDASCVRVLRDPFPKASVQARVCAPARSDAPIVVGQPLISPAQSAVFVRLEDGGLFVVQLPKSRRHNVGSGRKLHARLPGELVAAGHVRGGKATVPAFVVQDDKDVTLVRWGGKDGILRRLGKAPESLRPPPLDGRLFPLFEDTERTYYVDRGHRLLEFRPGNSSLTIATAVREVVRTNAGFATFDRNVSAPNDGLRLFRDGGLAPPSGKWDALGRSLGEDVPSLLAPSILGGLLLAFGVRSDTWEVHSVPWLALQDAASSTRRRPIEAARRVLTTEIRVPAHADVIGIIDRVVKIPGEVAAHTSPSLVLLDDHALQLRVISEGEGPNFTVTLPTPVSHLAVDSRTRVVACVCNRSRRAAA